MNKDEDKLVTLTITIQKSKRDIIKSLTAFNGTNTTTVLRKCIDTYIDKKGKDWQNDKLFN